jgi:hypothetical protein
MKTPSQFARFLTLLAMVLKLGKRLSIETGKALNDCKQNPRG